MTFADRPPVVDGYVYIPPADPAHEFAWMATQLKGQEFSAAEYPVGHLYSDRPQRPADQAPVEWVLSELDRFDIQMAVVDVHPGDAEAAAIQSRRDRFLPVLNVDPNDGMAAIRAIDAAASAHEIVGVSSGPSFVVPQVPINDRRYYPIYAKCVELDLPMFMTVGVPGPRVPMAPQYVGLLDDVCCHFPELKLVMRHGAEPWVDLAVKLMRKWPNLYYSTSAFAPKRYPKEIIDYANRNGGDRVIYAGYFAGGLSLDRIFSELEDLPLRDDVWPKFLRENALRVLGVSG